MVQNAMNKLPKLLAILLKLKLGSLKAFERVLSKTTPLKAPPIIKYRNPIIFLLPSIF